MLGGEGNRFVLSSSKKANCLGQGPLARSPPCPPTPLCLHPPLPAPSLFRDCIVIRSVPLRHPPLSGHPPSLSHPPGFSPRHPPSLSHQSHRVIRSVPLRHPPSLSHPHTPLDLKFVGSSDEVDCSTGSLPPLPPAPTPAGVSRAE